MEYWWNILMKNFNNSKYYRTHLVEIEKKRKKAFIAIEVRCIGDVNISSKIN